MEERTVTERLLDAAERLCETTAPSQVTVRAIAAEAEVSVGLLYHYFPDREHLIGAVLDRMAMQMSGAERAALPSPVLEELWSNLRQSPAFSRIVASLNLEGGSAAAVMSDHPLIARVAEQGTQDGREDPATLAGMVALLGLAGDFFLSTVNAALGRPADDQRVLIELLAALQRGDSTTFS